MDETTDSRRVVGRCPMGCGETLFLGDGGYVTCLFVDCPNPIAAGNVLASVEAVAAVVHAIERDAERTQAIALEAALTPYERALVEHAVALGWREMERSLKKVMGQAAQTLDANVVRMAIAEGRTFLTRRRVPGPLSEPPDEDLLSVVGSARRQADREEAEARGCKPSFWSSAVCVLGTKGCEVPEDQHHAPVGSTA